MISGKGLVTPYHNLYQGRAIGGGSVFFVGGTNLSDSHEGNDPQFPLNSIAAALAKCTDGQHDTIFVQDYWNNDTFPITLSKQTVRIIGLGCGGNPLSRWPILDGAGEAAFVVGSKGYYEIAGLSMGSTGGADPAILQTGGEGRGHIHHCAFGVHVVAQDGILSTQAADDFSFMLVEDCVFGQALTRDGLRLANCTRSMFWNNLFREVPSVGIRVTGGEGGSILGNRFFQKIGGDKGAAISLSNAGGFMVDDNHAMEDGEDPGNNPYLDTTTGVAGTTKNAWGLNYTGVTATAPALA